MENRSESRKKIMTILYQMSVYDKNKMKYEIEDVIKEVSEIDSEFIKEIVYGVVTYKNDIYELMYTDTPDIVCINEAVELAKEYSDDDVRKMINACLDKIYHNK